MTLTWWAVLLGAFIGGLAAGGAVAAVLINAQRNAADRRLMEQSGVWVSRKTSRAFRLVHIPEWGAREPDRKPAP